MADKLEIKWDENGLYKAIGNSKEVHDRISDMTKSRISKANSIGRSFKTGYYYDRAKGERLGGTTAQYGGDVKKLGKNSWPYGIVRPDNYAAIKDNYLHNTLLKVK